MNKREYQQQEIDRMVEALDLEDSTGRLAEILVGTCEITEACKGRSMEELIAGCIYLAIRQEREPVSLREVGEVIAVHTKSIHRAYQDIVETLEVQIQPESPTKYVDEYIERLNEEFDSKLGEDVAETARELIHESWGQGFSSGSSPIGIAAGAVYLAADIENKRVTQAEVAEIANVTPGTVRTNAQTHRARYEEVEWI